MIRNAADYLIKGATAVGSFGVGISQTNVDNTAGGNGAFSTNWCPGVAFMANLGADLSLVTDIGVKCWIANDQTVAKTNGTSTRSPAGIIEHVDANGVWARFDEALNRAY